MGAKIIQQFAEMVGSDLVIENDSSRWPLLARLKVDDHEVQLAIHLAPVGESHRDRDGERRFQTPGKHAPIQAFDDRLTIVLGVSTKPAVLVAIDPTERVDRATRQSVFLPGEALDRAAANDWDELVKKSGEKMWVFRPSELIRFVREIAPTFGASSSTRKTTTTRGTMTEGASDDELSTIAELLADLSKRDEFRTPAELTQEELLPSEFDPQDVAFDSGDWLHRLCQLQGWLRLDDPITGSDPLALAGALMLAVGDGVDQATLLLANEPALTSLGVGKLVPRLEQAVAAKNAFLEKLNETDSVEQANAAWLEAWEEIESAAGKPPANINATVMAMRIKELAGLADVNRLELNPSYQRDVVWANSDSQKLIESILRGIPLPSIILNIPEGSKVHEIVDGKQRLTAILRFMGRHPDGAQYVKSQKEDPARLHSDYRALKKQLQLKAKEEREHYLPFPLAKFPKGDPLHPLSGKYYSEIVEHPVQIQGEELTVSDVFDGTDMAYQLPVITYRKTPLTEIHRVFRLYNKQGKHLNAEELRNAAYHELAITRLLLVLSGDNSDIASLVPFIPAELHDNLGEIGEILDSRNFGTARFRRTKVLSWVSSAVLHPLPPGPKDTIRTTSTSAHINNWLDAITDDPKHPLRKEARLVQLTRDLYATLDAHDECSDAWEPEFTHKKTPGDKWEELPLVGTLVGCFLAIVAGATSADIKRKQTALRAFTDKNRRPAKSQSRTQWIHIATIATGIAKILELDSDKVSAELSKRYGYACLPTLQKLIKKD